MSLWLWTVVIIAVIVIVKGRSKLAKFPKLNFAKFIPTNTNWLRPFTTAVVTGGITFLVVGYLKIDWASMGFVQHLETMFGGITANMPAVVSVIAGVGVFAFGMNKKTSTGSGSSQGKGLLSTVGGVISNTVYGGLAVIVVLVLVWAVLTMIGKDDEVEAIILSDASLIEKELDPECGTNNDTKGKSVYEDLKTIILCRDGGSVRFTPIAGNKLEFHISKKEREDTPGVYRKNIKQFFRKDCDNTNSCTLTPIYTGAPNDRSAFARTDLEKIKVTYHSEPYRR